MKNKIAIEEIKKDIYKVNICSQIPFIINVDDKYIRITQPNANVDKGNFNPMDYFGKLFPQEIIIQTDQLPSFITALNKIAISSRLELKNDED